MASCWTREAEPAPCGAPEPGLAWHACVPRVRPTRWRCSGGPVSGGGHQGRSGPLLWPWSAPSTTSLQSLPSGSTLSNQGGQNDQGNRANRLRCDEAGEVVLVPCGDLSPES